MCVIHKEFIAPYQEKGINFPCVIMQKHTQLANFTELFCSHFTPFRNFRMLFNAVVMNLTILFLLKKFVYYPIGCYCFMPCASEKISLNCIYFQANISVISIMNI